MEEKPQNKLWPLVVGLDPQEAIPQQGKSEEQFKCWTRSTRESQ